MANKYIDKSYLLTQLKNLKSVILDNTYLGKSEKAASATTADSATKDGSGNVITTTYVTTSDSRLTNARASNDVQAYAKTGSGITVAKSVPNDAVFTDTNTWRPLGITADTACAGNDSRLSNARVASDVYSWAKASSKPSYTKSEVGLGNVDNKSEATIQSDILSALYPVGSVYMSFNNALPDVLKNIGTWTAVSAGYCLRTVTSGTGGTTSKAGATGGGSGNTGSTTLTAAQSGLPAHSHTAESNGAHTHSYSTATYTSGGINFSWGQGFSIGVGSTTGSSGAHTHTINSNTASDASEGHTHTIGSHTHTTGVPANVAIYMWKRTN